MSKQFPLARHALKDSLFLEPLHIRLHLICPSLIRVRCTSVGTVRCHTNHLFKGLLNPGGRRCLSNVKAGKLVVEQIHVRIEIQLLHDGISVTAMQPVFELACIRCGLLMQDRGFESAAEEIVCNRTDRSFVGAISTASTKERTWSPSFCTIRCTALRLIFYPRLRSCAQRRRYP